MLAILRKAPPVWSWLRERHIWALGVWDLPDQKNDLVGTLKPFQKYYILNWEVVFLNRGWSFKKSKSP